MANSLYIVYAILALLVAAVGLLWVGFSIEGPTESDRRDQLLAVVGAVFLVLLIGLFIV
jgi:hypothetical protein